MGKQIHTCKHHDHSHDYMVCEVCGHQYCDRYWRSCPRCNGSGEGNRHETLESRAAVPFVDVANVTEYGLTQKLSFAIRVF